MEKERIYAHMSGVVVDPQLSQPFVGEGDVVLSLEVVEELVLLESSFYVFGHDVGHARDVCDGYGFGAIAEDAEDALEPPAQVGSLSKVGQGSFGSSNFFRYFAQFI